MNSRGQVVRGNRIWSVRLGLCGYRNNIVSPLLGKQNECLLWISVPLLTQKIKCAYTQILVFSDCNNQSNKLLV